MADIIDFPIPKRPEILTWQCSCGGIEAIRQFGFWEIKESPSPAELGPQTDVIPLRLFRESPEDKIREQALFAAAMSSPVARGILERGGHVTIVGLAPPKEGEW
jgi:hypothetical protein